MARTWETKGAFTLQLALDIPLGFLLFAAVATHALPLFDYKGYEVPVFLACASAFTLHWLTLYKGWRRGAELLLFVPGAYLLSPWASHPWWAVFVYILAVGGVGVLLSRWIGGKPLAV